MPASQKDPDGCWRPTAESGPCSLSRWTASVSQPMIPMPTAVDGRSEEPPEALLAAPAGDQSSQAEAAPQGEGTGGGDDTADGPNYDQGLLRIGREGLTSPEDRRKAP